MRCRTRMTRWKTKSIWMLQLLVWTLRSFFLRAIILKGFLPYNLSSWSAFGRNMFYLVIQRRHSKSDFAKLWRSTLPPTTFRIRSLNTMFFRKLRLQLGQAYPRLLYRFMRPWLASASFLILQQLMMTQEAERARHPMEKIPLNGGDVIVYIQRTAHLEDHPT